MTARKALDKKIDHFNYRLCVEDTGLEEVPERWALHEVYYNADGDVIGHSAEPISLVAESYDGIREEVLLFVEAQTHEAWHVTQERWLPRQRDPSDA